MEEILVYFTRRKWNPVSWLIRWALPRSRFSLALSSHCLIVDGGYVIEATMLHGVRRVPKEMGLKGQTIVSAVQFQVIDRDAGLAFARQQVGLEYDWFGAIGLGLSPGRNWQDPSDWFCYELAAATLAAAGREQFRSNGHITEHVLLSIKP